MGKNVTLFNQATHGNNLSQLTGKLHGKRGLSQHAIVLSRHLFFLVRTPSVRTADKHVVFRVVLTCFFGERYLLLEGVIWKAQTQSSPEDVPWTFWDSFIDAKSCRDFRKFALMRLTDKNISSPSVD